MTPARLQGKIQAPLSPICPACGEYDALVSVHQTQLAGYLECQDQKGRWHYHDGNKMNFGLTCNKCGNQWLTAVLPCACWCGWPEHTGDRSEYGYFPDVLGEEEKCSP
jgi:hypothetical protein